MSQVHLEHRKALERELHNAGIKPQIDRTGSGHMRVSFEAGGKNHFILTSWTPSDHRSTLNARAHLRRILRDTGTLNQAKPVGKFDKALSLPAPNLQQSYDERIAQLETSVGTLLDMLASVAEKAGVDLSSPLQIEQPVVEQLPPSFPVAKPARQQRGGPPSKVHDLLLCIDYDWTPVATIRSREKTRSAGAISVALDKLKKNGLVEGNGKGMWRKVRQTQQYDSAEPPPAIKQPPQPPALPPASVGGKSGVLLDALEFEYRPLREITERDGRSLTAVGANLFYLKKLGLAESGARGMWRRVRTKPAPAPAAVAMPPAPPPHVPAPMAPQIKLLQCMEFNWLSRGEIARRSGLDGQALTSALSFQKRVGNVENGLRGMWRKRRLGAFSNGHHYASKTTHAPAG